MADKQLDILLRFQSQLDGINRSIAGVESLNQKIVESQQQARKAQSAFSSFGNFLKLGLGIDVARRAVDTLAQIPAAVTQLVRGGIQYNAVLEQQAVAFETLLGSKEASDERIRDLVQLAATTPFQLAEVVSASKVLQALGGSAIASGEGLRLVGDTAAALDSTKLAEFARWIGRLYLSMTTGQPLGQPIQELVQLGALTGENIARLRSLGGQTLSTAEAMAALTEVFGRNAGAMERQSRTFSGLSSTLKDSIDQIAGEASKPIFDVFKLALEDVLVLLGALPSAIDEAVGDIITRTTQLQKAAADVRSNNLKTQIEENKSAFESLKEERAKLERQILDFERRPRARTATTQAAELFIDQAQDNIEPRYIVEARARLAALKAEEAVIQENLNSKLTEERAVQNDILARRIAADEAIKNINAQEEKITEEYQKRAELMTEKEARLKQELADAEALWRRQFDIVIQSQNETETLRARENLRKQFESERARIEAELDAITKQRDKDASDREKERQNLIKQRQALEAAALSAQLGDLERQRKQVESDRLLTNEQRQATLLPLLQEENRLIEERIALLEIERANASSDEARIGIDSQLERLRTRQARTGGAIEENTPLGLGDEIRSGMIDVIDELGTSAQGIASIFTGPIRAGVQSVANVMNNLLGTTEYWQERLGTIGGSIIGSITAAISQMFATWIAKMIATWVLEKVFRKERKAEVTGELAMNAANATAVAISSYGAAALVGGAATAAAILGNVALATGIGAAGGFKVGGYTGNLSPDAVAGLVHGREYVFSAPAVANLGVDNLDAMHQAATSGGGGMGAMGGGDVTGSQAINIAIVRDTTEGIDFLEKQEGRRILYSTVRRDRRELGFPT